MIVLDPKLLFCSDRFSSFCWVTQRGHLRARRGVMSVTLCIFE